jgi:hypothetical protein
MTPGRLRAMGDEYRIRLAVYWFQRVAEAVTDHGSGNWMIQVRAGSPIASREVTVARWVLARRGYRVYETGRGQILSLAAAATCEVPLLRIFVAGSEP